MYENDCNGNRIDNYALRLLTIETTDKLEKKSLIQQRKHSKAKVI